MCFENLSVVFQSQQEGEELLEKVFTVASWIESQKNQDDWVKMASEIERVRININVGLLHVKLNGLFFVSKLSNEIEKARSVMLT